MEIVIQNLLIIKSDLLVAITPRVQNGLQIIWISIEDVFSIQFNDCPYGAHSVHCGHSLH